MDINQSDMDNRDQLDTGERNTTQDIIEKVLTDSQQNDSAIRKKEGGDVYMQEKLQI